MLWISLMLKNKLWNDPVICIPKTNLSQSLKMQIGLQLGQLLQISISGWNNLK